MCGILGYNSGEKDKLKIMAQEIDHRGPDAEGFFYNETVSLGHKRLSIIDLSVAGHQPMFYEPTQGACSTFHNSHSINQSLYGIVFNGEIYNFKDIKKELEAKSYSFTTNSDTEIILAAYHEWGNECVKYFNGMWAFCIYDKIKNVFFLSRDRLGKKPLYYYAHNSEFVFGSEIKVILKYGIKKDLDEENLNHYLFFCFGSRSHTMFKNIFILEPGYSMIYDLAKKEILDYKPYWNICFSQNRTDEKNLVKEIRNLVADSVKKRLLSDVPVGAFLSGGVDSSIIVSEMKKHVSSLETFSVGFDYADYNESHWAKIVSNKFQTNHHEITFTAKDVENLIPSLTYYYDNPLADASMIATYLVSKVAREYVMVSLSGMGADELFGGYSRYKEYLTIQRLLFLPTVVKNSMAETYSFYNSDKGQKLKMLLNSKDNTELYLKLFSHLYRNAEEVPIDIQKIRNSNNYFTTKSDVNNVLNFDQHTYLNSNGLEKEDRATMGNSLEGRAPFMDYRIVELANSIAPSLKIKCGETKYILKKAYEQILPHEILYRKKQGFGVPLEHYFRKELKDYAYQSIFEFQDFNFYDKTIIKKLWYLHQSGKSNYAPLFWNIIVFNNWYKRWYN